MKLSEIVVLSEDATIPFLRQEIERGFPDTKKRQHATNEVRIQRLQYTPILQRDILKINSTTNSNNGNTHTQVIEIRGVNFQPPNSGKTTSITDVSGEEQAITPAALNTSNVGVFCDCEDYQKRFANLNIRNNCHVGPPPQNYVRKTTTRPPVNPMNVPGMCKHVIAITDDLKRLRILK
jgi:hypothetical protein